MLHNHETFVCWTISRTHLCIYPLSLRFIANMSSSECYIRISNNNPPHFDLLIEKNEKKIVPGTNNLFFCLTLFLYLITTRFEGNLGYMHISSANQLDNVIKSWTKSHNKMSAKILFFWFAIFYSSICQQANRDQRKAPVLSKHSWTGCANRGAWSLRD